MREVTRDLVAGCSEYVGGHVNDNTSPAPSQCCVAYFAGTWIGELFPDVRLSRTFMFISVDMSRDLCPVVWAHRVRPGLRQTRGGELLLC